MPDHTLVLLRHAKSDWSGEEEADLARPLADRGRHQAPEAGRWLNANIDLLDLAIVSSAARAQETWGLVAAVLDTPPPVRIDERLYAASVSELLAVVRDVPDDLGAVVLVGHNPGIEELVSDLTGESIPMPTSAIAVITAKGAWTSVGHGSEVLRASGRPPSS